MDATRNPTEWLKVGRIDSMHFIGKDAICIGRGCHLFFFNLITKETSFYKANNADTGDGIRYFVGHRSLNFFAFAENCGNPNIFVLSYPDFKQICILEGGSKEGYISLVFSETSILISLGSLPYFTITVWNWRRGEKLGSSRSHVYRQRQILRCNSNTPVLLAQLGITSTKLHVWDILMCGKKCIMTHHKVKMTALKPAPLRFVLWTQDNTLLALDNNGCVFMVNSEYCLEKIIDCSAPGSLRTAFAFYKSSLGVFGPNMELRFYKKTGNTWEQEFSFIPPAGITKLKCSKSEIMIGLTERQYIVYVNVEEQSFSSLQTDESEFRDICLIYPTGEYFCLLSHGNSLTVLETATANLMCKFDLMGTALSISSNPEFPYIGIGYVNGILELLSVYTPTNVISMATFNLTRNPLSSIYFSEFGRVLVTADLATGEFFVIEGIPGGRMKVIATVNAGFQVVDYILVPSVNCYRLFVIPVTSNDHIIGNKIVRYCIIDKKNINIKEYYFPDPDSKYYKIYSTPRINRDRVFYAIPFDSKSIHEIEVKRGDNTISIIDSIPTGHQVRKNSLYLDKYHAITWSYDGYVIARSTDFKDVIGVALPHHRLEGGVQKAYIDPLGKYIISLGQENILACTSLVDVEIDEIKQQELRDTLASARYALLFKRKTFGFEPGAMYRDYTWLEVDKMHQAEEDEQRFRLERAHILEEFKMIQIELQALLNENYEIEEIKRLDTAEFNLDVRWAEETKEQNRVQCKDMELYLKQYIASQNKACEIIKHKCWDAMKTQKRKIISLSETTNVESYALLPADMDETQNLLWQEEQLKMEYSVNGEDKFEPWKVLSLDQSVTGFSGKCKVPSLKSKLDDTEEEDAEISPATKETNIAMAGSTAQLFIIISKDKYSQFELQTFNQLQILSAIIQKDNTRLKEYFNKEFENLMALKLRDINNIKEKNARLRHIVSEINYFSGEKMFISISDPKFTQTEFPEEMIRVNEYEISVRPYISPSEQALLDAKAAEEERIRLLLLADDFRERALMVMMNGVLEVRWEDELKKDVPIPKCAIEKEPEEFNEEDLRAMRDYEEKVKFLNSERERYKNLLDAEYTKLGLQVRERARKFNTRLAELLMLKIKVDTAIIQENLILCKRRLSLLHRLDLNDKELELKKTMVANEDLVRGIHHLIASLQESTGECRTQLELIQSKEKFLEKAFKKEISDLSPVVQEVAAKLLKKRPKANFKNINSTTLLQSLSRSVTTPSEECDILTTECKDYLLALDNFDLYVGVPQVMDEEAYALVCKHRRLKIEHEIKVKAAYTALIEAEATLSILQKRLIHKKEQNVRCMEDLAHVRTERLQEMRNIQVQIVLKQGFVEVPMCGAISDFEEAILVSRKDVEMINEIILKNGEIKLNTLRHSMAFHREIMKTEWIHKKLRMQIEDLNEQINDIEAQKVTKEMQSYLKGKEKILPFEVELEILKNSYENIIKEKKAVVHKIKKQIVALREDSRKVDIEIADVNVDVCECKLDKDFELDVREKTLIEERLLILSRRGRTVRQIQENHSTILMLQTELELLRLKIYPTLKYKIFS